MDRDLAGQLVAGKLLLEHVKTGVDGIRGELLAQMRPGDRITGTVGDTELGTATVARGRRSAVVTDERAFCEWVAYRYPQEIVTTVRESFRRTLLASCRDCEDPVDPHTGEVIPGVEVRDGEPYLMVKPSEGGEEWVSAQLSAMSFGKPNRIGG